MKAIIALLIGAAGYIGCSYVKLPSIEAAIVIALALCAVVMSFKLEGREGGDA